MSITTILAIWGAVISTAALTWNIIRGLQDRRCLKVKAEIANIMPGDPNKYYFCITMTNAGRRPVNIVGCGGSRIKEGEGLKNFLMITRDLPKMLKEGERHTEYSDDLSIFSDEIKEVSVWTSMGDTGKISKKNLNRLKMDVGQVIAEKDLQQQ